MKIKRFNEREEFEPTGLKENNVQSRYWVMFEMKQSGGKTKIYSHYSTDKFDIELFKKYAALKEWGEYVVDSWIEKNTVVVEIISKEEIEKMPEYLSALVHLDAEKYNL
jgi:hypothetical protein